MDTVNHLVRVLARLLGERLEVQEAYLFGSCARAQLQAHSDIDVAVHLDESRVAESSFGYQAEITAHLMSGLGTNRVDVVILNRATPLLYHRVLRDGVRVLSRDLRATTGREGRALSRYCDFAPQLEKMEAVLAGSGRSGSAAPQPLPPSGEGG